LRGKAGEAQERNGMVMFLSPGERPVFLGHVFGEVEWLAEDALLPGEAEEVAALGAG
jgi:hypothetical protein